MRFNDLTLGVVFAALGAFIVYSASDLPTARHIRFGPGLMPTIVGAGLVICGSILVLRDLLAAGRPTLSMELPDWASDVPRRKTMLLLFLAVAIFPPLIVAAGFQPATLVFLSILFISGGMVWIRAVITALLATTLVHLLFIELLNVPLPWGILRNLQPFLSPF